MKLGESCPVGLLGHSIGSVTAGRVAQNDSRIAAIVDAGHWSVTNIAGLTEGFAPGCGEGTRQTDGEPFNYVPVDEANGYTASFVTAFFAAHLRNEAAGLELLRSDPWPSAAPLEARE